MEPLLTIDEVCALFRLKKGYIYRLTHSRQIPFLKIGNHIRFRQSELEDWLAVRSVNASQPLVLAEKGATYRAYPKA